MYTSYLILISLMGSVSQAIDFTNFYNAKTATIDCGSGTGYTATVHEGIIGESKYSKDGDSPFTYQLTKDKTNHWTASLKTINGGGPLKIINEGAWPIIHILEQGPPSPITTNVDLVSLNLEHGTYTDQRNGYGYQTKNQIISQYSGKCKITLQTKSSSQNTERQ